MQRQSESTVEKESISYVEINGIQIPKFDMEVVEKYNQMNSEGNLPHIVETTNVRPRGQLKESILKQVKCDESSGIGNLTPLTNYSPEQRKA